MTATRRRTRPSRRVAPKPHLPSAQLAATLMRLAKREGLGNVCARAGVPERVVMRWRLGENGGHVGTNDADRVMTALGLFWWEIWTEETVREPLFTVTTYQMYSKKSPDGEYRLRRCKDRTIPYGDLGTDFWRLRQIEGLMSGTLEVAA